MTIAILFIMVCFLAYANGANDNFKGVATLFGSGTVNYRLALGWATITTLAGSICALFLAGTLIVKFSGKGLAPDTLIQSVPFMIAVAGGAGLTVILATRHGFPISTTHALLGAMVGSSLLATLGDMSLTPLLKNFVLPLLLSPVIALMLAALLYQTTRFVAQHFVTIKPLCLCVEETLPPVLSGTVAAMTADSSLSFTIDHQENCNQRSATLLFGFNTQRLVDSLHFCSAGAVCFARGLNDTPKIAALLLLAPGFSMQSTIGTIAVAMMLGGLLSAKRVAETMSHKITVINHYQGLSANLITAFLVIFASKLGMPVSTTHVSVGSLFGIGLTTGQSDKGVMASIALSWLLTLPCAALCAAVIYAISSHF
ncbi:MAG: inorganic phosphate transporter [Methylobacter sp.]|uniref:Phosphate transporter n=1 Tax=Candidatus Methylobacter titanis TaxID=3053457 RepID=A0AA43TMC1_9GAMM|nr:inorganic phosphate transporter [Candidatus Methylobacter titanis]